VRGTDPAIVTAHVFHSAALRGPEHYAVYLPAGYAASGRRYPVIYALHGLPSGGRGYLRMGIADWGRDAEATGRPVIVVAPQGARSGDTDPEWHDWGPGRDWETAVAVDLRRQIDAHYRTIDSRRGRALIGISAGGYGASIIGVRHPRLFSVIQSWSGYFRATNPVGDAPLQLGSPGADSAASVHSYVRRARRVFRRDRPIAFGFFVGDEDPLFVPENVQLHKELVAAGVPHRFAIYRGAHTGAFWDEHREDWVTDAVRALAPAT
jgi:enterochelin esterase-like enzyme